MAVTFERHTGFVTTDTLMGAVYGFARENGVISFETETGKPGGVSIILDVDDTVIDAIQYKSIEDLFIAGNGIDDYNKKSPMDITELPSAGIRIIDDAKVAYEAKLVAMQKVVNDGSWAATIHEAKLLNILQDKTSQAIESYQTQDNFQRLIDVYNTMQWKITLLRRYMALKNLDITDPANTSPYKGYADDEWAVLYKAVLDGEWRERDVSKHP